MYQVLNMNSTSDKDNAAQQNAAISRLTRDGAIPFQGFVEAPKNDRKFVVIPAGESSVMASLSGYALPLEDDDFFIRMFDSCGEDELALKKQVRKTLNNSIEESKKAA